MHVQWATPTAVDNCGTPTITGSIAPGTCFGIGTKDVVYYAIDAKGNTAKCVFSITVNRPNLDSICATDTIKPRFVTCPTSSIFTLPATSANLDSCTHVQWATPTAVDNCGTTSVSSSLQSGSCLPVGSTTVVYTAADATGNTATCSFTVTVIRPNIDSILCANDTIRPRFENCPISSTFALSATSTNVDSCMRVQWPTPTAFDNCSTTSVSSSLQSGSCLPVGTTTVVYTAVDAKGNIATCSFSVTVIRPSLDSICVTDTIKPRFVTCPTSSMFTLPATSTNLDSCMHVQWATPTAVDNCGTPTITGSIAPGTCFGIGTKDVVYYAIDAKGNTAKCVFSITVNRPNLDSICATDTIKPRFVTCPTSSMFTLSATSLDSCMRVQWATPTATDNCSTPTLTSSLASGSCIKVGTTTVVYTAVDAKGNTATCSFTVTVNRPNLDSICATDTIKPRFTNCPISTATGSITNFTYTTSDSCMRVQWPTLTAVDNCGVPTITGSLTSGACLPVGITPVVYTATDAKGNQSICSFNITVLNPCANDTIKPRFSSCPTNKSVTTKDSCVRVSWTTPLAYDNCGTPTVSSNFTQTSCFPIGTTPVIYTATDRKGNQTTCSFKITVVNPCATDSIKPRFVNCPTNKTLTTFDTCARIQWTAPIATDNCSTPVVTSNFPATACFPIGVSNLVYTATDAKGNTAICSLTVTVVNPCATDSIKPRFTSCPQSIKLNSLDTCIKIKWNTPTATDNCSTPVLTSNFKPGACFKEGTTVVTYTATDIKGNSSICSFTVTIVNPCANDTIKPRFTNCPTNKTLTTLDSCARIQWSTPTAYDNCGTPVITNNLPTSACFPVGTTPVIYTATDAKGNQTTCSFTVTVVNPCANDTLKPRFTSCPQNIVINSLDTCAKATWNKPLATDNCSTPTVAGNFTSGTCFSTGTTAVTYTATDAKGNSSVCSFTVTVKNPCTNDTIKPTFYNCPANITKETGDSSTTVTWRTPAATDNCVVRSITTSHPSGSRFNIGTTTVTYAATDAAGNTRYCTFTVTIKHVITPCSVDSIAPVLANCPADISLTTASASAVAQWKKPTATDNCSTPSVVGTANPGASFPLGTTTVFYTATDAKRNVSTCSFNVVVTKQALVIDSTKCYILVARSSKKALSIANASTAPGADAVQWSYTGGANQKWGITTADSNSVNLTVKHTNLNLDTRWGSLANGSKLMQWAKSTAATQKWQLIPLSDGYYKIINKGSGRALSVNGGTTVTADGSLLVQSTYAGLTSQQWSIEAVACTSTGTSPSAYTTNDVLEANATAELHRARIEWVDNTGYKNDYYEVEKLNTTSGKFESLAIINNKSFDNQLSSQTAYDEAPTEGDNFYRVKVVYLDSLTKVSPVQKVAFSNLQTVKIFPNPASDYVDIDLATYSNETVNIDLYNGFGQKVAAKTVQKGNNSTVHFDISEQQNGNYLIRITAQGKRDVVKQLNIVR